MTQNPLSDSESKKQTQNKEYYQTKLENEIVGSQKVSRWQPPSLSVNALTEQSQHGHLQSKGATLHCWLQIPSASILRMV